LIDSVEVDDVLAIMRDIVRANDVLICLKRFAEHAKVKTSSAKKSTLTDAPFFAFNVFDSKVEIVLCRIVPAHVHIIEAECVAKYKEPQIYFNRLETNAVAV